MAHAVDEPRDDLAEEHAGTLAAGEEEALEAVGAAGKRLPPGLGPALGQRPLPRLGPFRLALEAVGALLPPSWIQRSRRSISLRSNHRPWRAQTSTITPLFLP